ncbi:MAG TPA: MoxR family ATPase, partial [Castellaniella sp.]|nr:MoxR family ATPase [Castellaniella sp.]
KKKPSTSEFLDWLRLLLAESVPPSALRDADIPPLAGALLKNEQDLGLLQRLASMGRRTAR